MESIRSVFSQFAEVSDGDWNVFSARLQPVDIPKKTILLQSGKIEQYLSFIELGVIRCFIPKEETELTFAFRFAGEFFSGYDSFITQTPSSYQIETLEPTKLWRIDYQGLQEVYEQTSVGHYIGRVVAEKLFMAKAKREQALLNDTAEERYRLLLEKQPQLIQTIPLKYLASYIGITPQALSRIRRRIS